MPVLVVPSRAYDHTLIISAVDTHKVLRSLAAKEELKPNQIDGDARIAVAV